MDPRTLTYDIAGDGDPLVLVPGGLTGWISWIPHQERLSDHHRVIRVQPIHNELGSAGKPGVPGYTEEVDRESLRLTLEMNERMEALAGKPITEDDLANFLAQGRASEDPAQAREHPNWDQWVTHCMPLSWSYEGSSTRSAEELRRIDCPVLLIKGDQTEAWLARVADRSSSWKAAMPLTSSASIGSWRSSKPISIELSKASVQDEDDAQ